MTSPTEMRHLTPDEVLQEIRFALQIWTRLDQLEIESLVQRTTTLDELNSIDYEIDWIILEDNLGITLDNSWHEKWKPTDLTGDACDDIALRICVPVIHPVTILGKTCKSAGAFRTLKKMLVDAGAVENDIRPSTTVQKFINKHPSIFRQFRLALSSRRIYIQKQNVLASFCLLAAMIFIVIGCSSSIGYIVIAALCLLLSIVLFNRRIGERQVCKVFPRTNNIYTFKDFIRTAMTKPTTIT